MSCDYLTCYLGVRQGESLSPFLSMYLNDIEQYYETNGYEGEEIGMLKLFVLLYADDIVIMSESENGLQNENWLINLTPQSLVMVVMFGDYKIVKN